jgi:hypothetical protein
VLVEDHSGGTLEGGQMRKTSAAVENGQDRIFLSVFQTVQVYIASVLSVSIRSINTVRVRKTVTGQMALKGFILGARLRTGIARG